jgi:hypothetical protein
MEHECSICCEEIAAATGQVTLSCSHTFHLGCVGSWLLRSTSCPLCRGETCEKEQIQRPDAAEEEEDEEDNLDDEIGEWEHYDERETIIEEVPEFDPAAHALWVMRNTFEMLDDGKSILSEGSAPQPSTDPEWTWKRHLSPCGGTVETVWRRSMHQMSTSSTTLGDERGYESA